MCHDMVLCCFVHGSEYHHLFSVEHYRDYVLQVLRNCILKNQPMVATFRHEKLYVFSILSHRVTVIHLKNILKTVIFNKFLYLLA